MITSRKPFRVTHGQDDAPDGVRVLFDESAPGGPGWWERQLDMWRPIPAPPEAYRFTLSRDRKGSIGFALWIMLNPSTATETKDDPTIRKVMAFTPAHLDVIVVNLVPYRATKPADLIAAAARGEDVHGNNAAVILEMMQGAEMVVCAWGANAAHPMFREPRRSLAPLLDAYAAAFQTGPVVCLGVTKDGHPKHPLYVPYSQPFVQFDMGKWRDL